MNDEEKMNILFRINELSSIKWSTYSKQEIFRKSQTDGVFLNKVKQAYVALKSNLTYEILEYYSYSVFQHMHYIWM